MRIQTGQGTIPLITLIGIWSISALNALPGLAVSPILGKLSAIFPHSTELDIQMLSSLPSLLIIPFIILSGKLTEKINNILLLQVGLVVFSLSGILYLLSTKMWQLIAVSALLGIGFGVDRTAFHWFDLPLFHRGIPNETVWPQFRDHECDLSISNDSDRVSGGSKLASSVHRLSVSADLDRSFVLSEKEYFTLSRYKYACNCKSGSFTGRNETRVRYYRQQFR